MTIKFEVNGMTIVVDDAEERLQVLREIAQIQLETESATPSTPTSPVPEDDGLKLPDGYKPVGETTKQITKYGRVYKKGSIAYGKIQANGQTAYLVALPSGNAKIGKGIVRLTPDTSGSQSQTADGNFTTFSGQLVIAGQELVVRLAHGELRHGGESTNLHFAKNLRGEAAVRKALSNNSFRFSGYLTKLNDDSNSTWYINTKLEIDQVQALFS
jgi:hypothetical protein